MRLDNQPKSIEVSEIFNKQQAPSSIQNAGALGWAVDFLRRQMKQGRHSEQFQYDNEVHDFERYIAPITFEARREKRTKDAGKPYISVNPFAPGFDEAKATKPIFK